MSESKVAKASSASRLGEISCATNVVSDPAQLAEYAIGGLSPAVVVKPESDREVADIVKFAASEKLAIVPCGARTKLAMGQAPRQYDLAIDMTRLDGILAYDPGDLTLSVEPGVMLAKLAEVLVEHKQFLPLAAPFSNRATVGGTIASGVDSPLRQFFGTARDYVLGMELVAGEGVIIKSGGRVVKNVAGYDLHKLMIGVLGTLGVITKIHFRTFPMPTQPRAFVAGCHSSEQALEMRWRVAGSVLRPLTIEILSPGAAELLASEVAAQIVPGILSGELFLANRWIFVSSFAGNEKVLERNERELRKIAEEAGVADLRILENGAASSLLGRLREFVPISLQNSAATTVLKMSVLPARMNQMLAAIASVTDANRTRWAAMARGLGVMYIVLLSEPCNEQSLRLVAEGTQSILGECERLGGNGSILWCPAEWKASLEIWGGERADFEQMKQLKTVFDPHGIFAPGRFVGGI